MLNVGEQRFSTFFLHDFPIGFMYYFSARWFSVPGGISVIEAILSSSANSTNRLPDVVLF